MNKVRGTMRSTLYLIESLKALCASSLEPIFEKAGRSEVVIDRTIIVMNVMKLYAAPKSPMAALSTNLDRTYP